MWNLKRQWKKKFICFVLIFVFCFSQDIIVSKAGSFQIGDYVIVDGFTPPNNETIVHHQNNSSSPYTKIANAVTELWVGEHHRFTVVENRRKSVKIRWYSSNPEVASIDKITGELTAHSAGTVTITMQDSANKTKHKCEITVRQLPVLPEMPKEWYTVEDILNEYTEEKLGIGLVLKKEYLYLYEQCSMIKIPEEVEGEHVVCIRLEDDYATFDVSYLGFNKLEWMQCSQEVAYQLRSSKKVRTLCSDGLEWLIFCTNGMPIPESVHLIWSEDSLESIQDTIRIPAGVKLIFNDRMYHDVHGVYRGDNVQFAVDGNNTNYYSIFGVLFTYPYYELGQEDRDWLSVTDGVGMEANKNILLVYPAEKTGSVYRVPDGIERIGDRAFDDVKYLKKIILPDSVKEIGNYAFCDIKHKIEIVIPASVTLNKHQTPFHNYNDFLDSDEEGFVYITIITPKGSDAEAYAIEHGIAYRNE